MLWPHWVCLDTTNGKMYWTDEATFTIERANLDGSGKETLVGFAQVEYPYGVLSKNSIGAKSAPDLILFTVDAANFGSRPLNKIRMFGPTHTVQRRPAAASMQRICFSLSLRTQSPRAGQRPHRQKQTRRQRGRSGSAHRTSWRTPQVLSPSRIGVVGLGRLWLLRMVDSRVEVRSPSVLWPKNNPQLAPSTAKRRGLTPGFRRSGFWIARGQRC